MDLLSFPAEIILHICELSFHSDLLSLPTTPTLTTTLNTKPVSYLDLPELDVLSSLSPHLRHLAHDRALHRTRILVVAPSRVEHALFAYGGALRPSIGDLVHWGVMKGLGLDHAGHLGGMVSGFAAAMWLKRRAALGQKSDDEGRDEVLMQGLNVKKAGAEAVTS